MTKHDPLNMFSCSQTFGVEKHSQRRVGDTVFVISFMVQLLYNPYELKVSKNHTEAAGHT